MAKILITGGSGLLGKAISKLLLKMGHQVRLLSRTGGETNGIHKFRWDPSSGYIDLSAFEGVSHVIHLAGAGIADRAWTSTYKKEILNSRVHTAQLLFDSIVRHNFPIEKIVGASAVGYYGSVPSEHIYSETDPAGADFPAEVCKDWEQSYAAFSQKGIPLAIVRLGIVLAHEGGAYKKLAPIFKHGLGTVFADGKQYFPWIHIDDAAAIFVKLLFDNSLTGAYNAVSSDVINNREFAMQLARSLNSKLRLPVIPEWMLRFALGQRALSVTRGLKIDNAKIKSAGFSFKYDDIQTCLLDLAKHP